MGAVAVEPAAVAASGGSTPGTAVNMPSLSPTMEEGTIVKWHKAEGEAIAAGDVLCDIQTDKAVVSMEADDDGIVAKIIMEEGSGAKVGTLIALLVGEGEDWKDVAIPGSAPPPPAPAAAQPEAPAPVPATSGQPLTALQYVPQINANVVNEELVPQSNIDISVAVATPAGLITPIVKDAAGKPIQQISADVKELAGRAKESKLKLDEFQGGTFTISNLGMFGIAEFTAIINAPQVAILAVGGGRSVIHPDTMQATTVMTATLSFDRRYIDEAAAADFMAVFQRVMEQPELLGTGYLPSVKLDRMAAAIP